MVLKIFLIFIIQTGNYFNMKINLFDSNFAHHKTNNSVAYNQHSKYIDWHRGVDKQSETCFITDQWLYKISEITNFTQKIAWLVEPRAIIPDIYRWVEHNNKLFDYVLTFDKELTSRDDNFLFYPYGTSNIIDIHSTTWPVKDKMLSIIASNKMFTPGHAFRHQIIQLCKMRDDIDVYGRGVNPIDKKEDGLNRYMFSIVVENSRDNYYFSEKILDCLICKTIPIYWGCDTSQFLDQSSILTFNTQQELTNILDNLTADLYYSMMKSLEENYNRIIDQDLAIPENWIFKHYPFLFDSNLPKPLKK